MPIEQKNPLYIRNQSKYKVDNVIVLAAGYGFHIVPLTYETLKGLIPIKGQPIVERQIVQLMIKDITTIVGYSWLLC